MEPLRLNVGKGHGSFLSFASNVGKMKPRKENQVWGVFGPVSPKSSSFQVPSQNISFHNPLLMSHRKNDISRCYQKAILTSAIRNRADGTGKPFFVYLRNVAY